MIISQKPHILQYHDCVLLPRLKTTEKKQCKASIAAESNQPYRRVTGCPVIATNMCAIRLCDFVPIVHSAVEFETAEERTKGMRIYGEAVRDLTPHAAHNRSQGDRAGRAVWQGANGMKCIQEWIKM